MLVDCPQACDREKDVEKAYIVVEQDTAILAPV